MATLTNTKIKDTYDGLLKTTDNEALDVSGVTLIEDGLGNASALSVGRSGNGVTITGSLNATLATAAQPNITSVGTLSSLAVSGNVIANSSSTDEGSFQVYGNNSTFVVGADKGGGASFKYASSGNLEISPRAGFNTSFTNGNVGIGVSPESSSILHIKKATGDAKLTLETADAYDSFINFSAATSEYSIGFDRTDSSFKFCLANNITSNEHMRIDSSGNVGIGTSSPTGFTKTLKINAPSGTIGMILSDADTDRAGFYAEAGTTTPAYLFTNNSKPLLFNVAGSERMRITSVGHLFVNTDVTPDASNGGFGVFASGGSTYIYNSTEQSTSWFHLQFINPNGIVGSISTNGSATSYNTSSDYRLKENVVEMTGALDRVDALKPSRFNFIGDEKTVDGFLAHEVAEVIPEAITGEKDAVDEEGNPIYQGIDQSKIVPLLVGAIKELRAEIELLKSQLS